jgi:hypothetical protein
VLAAVKLVGEDTNIGFLAEVSCGGEVYKA